MKGAVTAAAIFHVFNFPIWQNAQKLLINLIFRHKSTNTGLFAIQSICAGGGGGNAGP